MERGIAGGAGVTQTSMAAHMVIMVTLPSLNTLGSSGSFLPFLQTSRTYATHDRNHSFESKSMGIFVTLESASRSRFTMRVL